MDIGKIQITVVEGLDENTFALISPQANNTVMVTGMVNGELIEPMVLKIPQHIYYKA